MFVIKITPESLNFLQQLLKSDIAVSIKAARTAVELGEAVDAAVPYVEPAPVPAVRNEPAEAPLPDGT